MCLALVSMDDELASPQRPISALTVRKMALMGGVASTLTQALCAIHAQPSYLNPGQEATTDNSEQLR